VLDYVGEINDKLGMTLLNDHITPDPTYCVNALMELVEDMKNAVVARFGKKGGTE
jgi:hypothetical protein